ncbi:CidA/LrgA family protein [Massilia sp. TSP1-1-2]|uniref:CidA/LrgA family protein n=1 Tax=unclassified Massilia TaxID=2609279 RepID=UPI003CFA11F5
MLFTFTILLMCQCIGEGIAFAFRLPVPGPVIGMLILFCLLVMRPSLLDKIQSTGDALLQHLSLLFVPAGVGIFVAAASLQGQWPAIVGAVIASTWLTLAVTALVMRAALKEDKHE